MPTAAQRPDDRLLEALLEEFARHEAELSERVLDALVEKCERESAGSGDADEVAWGPAPSLDEVVSADVRTPRLFQQEREQVLDGLPAHLRGLERGHPQERRQTLTTSLLPMPLSAEPPGRVSCNDAS